MILADILQSGVFGGGPEDLAWWSLWLITVGSMVLLLVGADRAVGAAVKLAKAIHIPTVVIGATVVSLGTTMPEACVSVMAAFKGEPGLALANGVGSIICDTALIFGLCCLLVKLPLDRYVLRRHGWLQLGSGALLVGIVVVGALFAGGIGAVTIPRAVGVGLLGLLGVYMYLSFRWARSHPELVPVEARAEVKAGHLRKIVTASVAGLVIGLGMVILGSDLMIGAIKELGLRYNVPKDVLGVTVVAFGTSLPELATALAAIKRGHPELLVGNIIGADILNVLFVVGAAATASPLRVPPLFFTLHLPVMMGALLLLRFYIFTSGKSFKRWQGIPLLALYVLYMARLVMLRQY